MKRKPINRKVALGIGVMLAIVAIIGISSFFPFIIDPTTWQTMDFLTKEIIVVVITIAGMVTSMFIGQAKNADDDRSEIARARRRFQENLAKISDRAAFKQWVRDVLEPADKDRKKKRLMEKHGITQEEVFGLEINEIKELVGKPQKYGDRFFHSITEEQRDFILRYKEGRYSIDFVSPEYYLTVSSINNDKTISEKAGKETKTKTILLTTQMVSKIVRGLIIAITFASLVYDSTKGGDAGSQATAWMTFASRIFSLLTATFSGYQVGSKTNDIEADYINMRCDVQEEYLQDKSYKAKTEQELAKEEFADRVRKESVLMLEGGK